MKAYDYKAVTFDGAVYCTGCIPDGAKDEDIYPIFADSEWDFYPVCDGCGEVHDYMGLTDEGQIEHTRRKIEEEAHNDKKWRTQ